MNEGNDFALAPRPPNAVEKGVGGASRILSEMVKDTLATVKQERTTLTVPIHRVGDENLCESDHFQLVAWATQLRLDPLEVLNRLKSGLRFEGQGTRIENGRFVTLNWDPGLLPLANIELTSLPDLVELTIPPIAYDEWKFDALDGRIGVTADGHLPPGYDLSARVLTISGTVLPKLRSLECELVGLQNLAIASAPMLEHLNCAQNHLTTLDLRPFPKLKNLICNWNCKSLEHLDLSHVPELRELDCEDNLLTELDLSGVPKLRKLNCSQNSISELVVPFLPELFELICSNTNPEERFKKLQRIEIQNAPSLEVLDCDSNSLEKLDLSGVPRLKRLNCGWNLLAELDLKPVTALEVLTCDANDLRELNLSSTPLLKELSCSNVFWYSIWIEALDIRPLHHLVQLTYDRRTQLIERSDQASEIARRTNRESCACCLHEWLKEAMMKR